MSADATFLLPAWSAFGRQSFAVDIARAFGRADRLPDADSGRIPQILRHFRPLPARWSPAAVSRQRDVGDATDLLWLRVDPAFVRPDINGVRLMAYGKALALAQTDADELLPALRPLFGDCGFALDAPTPTRWYVRMQRGSECPNFSEPEDALGEDMFEHLPQGAAARQWRALLNDVQIVLHQHPLNIARRERGLPTVNALWVWGGGVLPDRVSVAVARVYSDDESLRDHAHLAAVSDLPLRTAMNVSSPQTLPGLYDLRHLRDAKRLQDDWLRPAIETLRARTLRTLVVDAADGTRLRLEARHAWRFWRRPWSPPASAAA